MWRDPYGGGVGERLFMGLLALLVAAIALKILAVVITPLIPALTTAVIVSGGLLWFLRRRHY